MEKNREWSYRGLVALFVLSHQLFLFVYSISLIFLSSPIYYLVFKSIIILYIMLANKLFGRKREKSFHFQWSYLGWSLLGFLALFLGHLLLSFLFQETGNGGSLVESTTSLTGRLYMIELIVQLIFLAPIYEGLIYRGLVMTALSKYRRYYFDVFASAVLFGLSHVIQYDFVLGDFLRYSVSGLILALLFRKTKIIQYSIALHMTWNAFTVLLAYFIG